MQPIETISIAPVLRDAEHAARVEAATRAFEDAHRAVADAAGAWYDEGGAALPRSPRRHDGPEEAAADLARAVEAWRAAGEAFLRALSGRP